MSGCPVAKVVRVGLGVALAGVGMTADTAAVMGGSRVKQMARQYLMEGVRRALRRDFGTSCVCSF
jgi:hypothetical protein